MRGLNTMKLLTGILSLMLIIGTAPVMVFAANSNVPTTVSYQCDLAGAEGTSVTMTFIFYNSSDNEQFTKVIDNIPITNGIVSTEVPIDDEYLDVITKMGVKVNNGDVMNPKVNLTSSIFAMKAKYAEHLVDDGGPGSIDGTALVDGAITTEKIADEAITSEKLNIGAISSEKLSVKTQSITPTTIQNELTEDDQGLILVKGNTTVNLPIPAESNKGFKYTIKKIDDGLRYQVEEKQRTCEVASDMVTIMCGTGADYNFITSNTNYIENRTYYIELKYKNEFVTLVSDGSIWYVLESNPPQDIVNPIPGNVVVVDDIAKSTPAILSWTFATDCPGSNCYNCGELEYMAYIGEGTDGEYKLRTLDAIKNVGKPCDSSWTDSYTMACNPGAFDDFYKVNLVVRDSAGNLSIYDPPGDNTPPVVTNTELGQVANTIGDSTNHYIGLSWNPAKVEPGVEFTYSVFYVKDSEEGGENCLMGMDNPEGFIPANGCDIVTAIDTQKVSVGTYSASSMEDTLNQILAKSEVTGELRVDITEGLEADTDYWLTVIVQDPAGNKKQYNVVSEKTKSN